MFDLWNYFVNIGTIFMAEVYEYLNMLMSCVSDHVDPNLDHSVNQCFMECVTCWFQYSTNSEIDTIPWLTPGMNKLHWWIASKYSTIKGSHSHCDMNYAPLIALSLKNNVICASILPYFFPHGTIFSHTPNFWFFFAESKWSFAKYCSNW